MLTVNEDVRLVWILMMWADISRYLICQSSRSCLNLSLPSSCSITCVRSIYLQSSSPAPGRARPPFYWSLQTSSPLSTMHGDFAARFLLDLSAAFDTADHHILLERLRRSFGFDLALDWFRSYLSGLTQLARHAASSSSSVTGVVCGVQQGSVLGPILLVLYCRPCRSHPASRIHDLLSHLYTDNSQVCSIWHVLPV